MHFETAGEQLKISVLTSIGIAQPQHRNTVTISIRPQDYPALNRCTYDKTMRVMVFCADDEIGIKDISFPHQSELKVNGGDVKANLRGLKNKPGSTRPVDITHLLRLDKFTYTNNVEFTYALTTKVNQPGNLTVHQVSDQTIPGPKWRPWHGCLTIFFSEMLSNETEYMR
jgi:hypothetical protein